MVGRNSSSFVIRVTRFSKVAKNDEDTVWLAIGDLWATISASVTEVVLAR
jgi:hypothetical protein